MESKEPTSIAPRVLSRLVTVAPVACEAEDIAHFGNLNGSQAPDNTVDEGYAFTAIPIKKQQERNRWLERRCPRRPLPVFI
jgi:hypothetical protein